METILLHFLIALAEKPGVLPDGAVLPMGVTRTKSLKIGEVEWALWSEAASVAGESFHGWILRACAEQAALERAVGEPWDADGCRCVSGAHTCGRGGSSSSFKPDFK